MKKKICPVCDHVMKGSHYCRVCRKWIRHPNVINADYYLNERHPAGEESCEYHHPSFMEEGRAGTPSKPAARPVGQSGTQGRSQPAQQSGTQGRSQPAQQSGTQGRSQPVQQSSPQRYSQPARQSGTQGRSQPAQQSSPQRYSQPARQNRPQRDSRPAQQNQPGKSPLSSFIIIIFVAVFLTILLITLVPVMMFFL